MAGGAKQEWQEWRQYWQERPEAFRKWLQQQLDMAMALDAETWEAFVRNDVVFARTLNTWYPPGRQTQPAFWHDVSLNNPAQPVIGICWYEARAYCAWLSAQTGQAFRLPTEAEWEAAARGQHSRRYAYGDDLDTACCNLFDTHIRRTTPIGVFPGGTTPEGLVDMTGNIWEWTSSLFHAYPYDAADGREEVQATSAARRVVRGGAWGVGHHSARTTCRWRLGPDMRGVDTGLRVVRVVPFS